MRVTLKYTTSGTWNLNFHHGCACVNLCSWVFEVESFYVFMVYACIAIWSNVLGLVY